MRAYDLCSVLQFMRMQVHIRNELDLIRNIVSRRYMDFGKKEMYEETIMARILGIESSSLTQMYSTEGA